MENKTELGHLYGSRISKNGKWLNLSIVTTINGQTIYITCPIRMEENREDGKPFAQFHYKSSTELKPAAELDKTKAMLLYIPVYEDRKPTEAQAAGNSDLPF